MGAGIYVLIAAAAVAAGMHAPISFLITAVLIGLTGAFAFPSSASRSAGVAAGEAAYVRAAFRSERMATFIGVLVIAMALISASTISVGRRAISAYSWTLPDKLLITGVIAAMAAIAARGIVRIS